MVSPETLRQIPLFQELSDNALCFLSENISAKRVRANEVIFQAGEPGDSMYIIDYGGVFVIVYDNCNVEHYKCFLGRHEIFGEMALLTDTPRSATIVAAMDSDLFVVDKNCFSEILKYYPVVAVDLLETIACRLRQTDLGNHGRRIFRVTFCHSASGMDDTRYFSSSVAAAIRAVIQKKVALLDLNPGTLISPNKEKKERQWEILLDTQESLDNKLIESLMVPMGFGVDILSPPSAAILKKSSVEIIPRILSLLLETYSFIVIASTREPELAEFTKKALEQSEQVLFALKPESLNEALRQWHEIQDSRTFGTKSTHIVLRHENKRKAGIAKQVKEQFGTGIAFQFPPDLETERYFMQHGTFNEQEPPGLHNDLQRIARQIAGMTVGVALGGGGARGIAHIGVLQVFEQAQIRVCPTYPTWVRPQKRGLSPEKPISRPNAGIDIEVRDNPHQER